MKFLLGSAVLATMLLGAFSNPEVEMKKNTDSLPVGALSSEVSEKHVIPDDKMSKQLFGIDIDVLMNITKTHPILHNNSFVNLNGSYGIDEGIGGSLILPGIKFPLNLLFPDYPVFNFTIGLNHNKAVNFLVNAATGNHTETNTPGGWSPDTPGWTTAPTTPGWGWQQPTEAPTTSGWAAPSSSTGWGWPPAPTAAPPSGWTPSTTTTPGWGWQPSTEAPTTSGWTSTTTTPGWGWQPSTEAPTTSGWTSPPTPGWVSQPEQGSGGWVPSLDSDRKPSLVGSISPSLANHSGKNPASGSGGFSPPARPSGDPSFGSNSEKKPVAGPGEVNVPARPN